MNNINPITITNINPKEKKRNPYTVKDKHSDSLSFVATYLYHYLRNNQFVINHQTSLNNNQRITKFGQAKRGNKIYAYRMHERIEQVQKCINDKAIFDNKNDKTNILFLTLTQEYDITDYDSIIKSWLNMREYATKFLRLVKKEYDVKDYVVVFEAHEHGGCHAHIVLILPEAIHCWTDKGKKGQLIYRAPNEVNDKFHELYARACGHNYNIDVQGSYTSAIAGYLTKELGKMNCCEDSVKRYFRNEDSAKDRKRIFTFAMAIITHTRQFRVSQTIKIEESKVSEDDLISNMNKSTELFVTDKSVTLERKIMKDSKISPYSYIVNESDEDDEKMSLYCLWHCILFEGKRIESSTTDEI